MKALYGEMADGRDHRPAGGAGAAEELGYEFRRPDLEDALRDATGR